MKISGIYQIQSKIKPGRIYIGSAVNIQHRWDRHISDLKLNKHHSVKLQRHYNKYGKKDLVFIILELCFPEFLTAREQYYINKLRPYFNICPKAGNSLGYKHSEKAKRKMSEANKGRKGYWSDKKRPSFSEETRKKMSEAFKGRIPWNKGKHLSDEQKQKITLANKRNIGRPVSKETRKKISETEKRTKYKLRIA